MFWKRGRVRVGARPLEGWKKIDMEPMARTAIPVFEADNMNASRKRTVQDGEFSANN